jgi:tetratricopeptide (TPR) repeat protein
MPEIYNVTIQPTSKENRFHISWFHPKTGTCDSFENVHCLDPEEIDYMWQWQRCQLNIGKKLFQFLDGNGHQFQKVLRDVHHLGTKLHLYLHTSKETEDWPFELLAMDENFLLAGDTHLIRQTTIGVDAINQSPANHRLKILFMASSPLGINEEYDFEKEEESIFQITETLPIQMDVEDSGSLEGLGHQLQQSYDVVHLSGEAGIDKAGQPFIVLENETGESTKISPEELWEQSLKQNPPILLFLSGSHTGETPGSNARLFLKESRAEGSFARILVEKFHIPAVLSWGRKVSDQEAHWAGKIIYKDLSRGESIRKAVQRARDELLRNFKHSNKPAWPSLRLFSNETTFQGLVKKEQQQRPKPRLMKHTYLKSSKVQVLETGFVGRRRHIQKSLKTLKLEEKKNGIIILGTGGLGKSCLSGKICERFPKHKLIIVHGKFNTITIGQALKDAFIATQDLKGLDVLSQRMEMKDKLIKLCSSSFLNHSYLLLLDDFEQNIEGADKGQPGSLFPEAAHLLEVLLRYLPFCEKSTQLIITCRYDFSLSEEDQKLLEERLERIWLTSFHATEQRKKKEQLPHISNYKDNTLVPDLLAAGHGNPRLMEWLNELVGQLTESKVPELLVALKDKQEEFINRHVISELLHCGGEEMTLFLQWCSIYRHPVLEAGIKEVAIKAGLTQWQELLQVSMRLSLAEHDQTRLSYQVAPLLREHLLQGIANHLPCHEAAFKYYQDICEAKETINPIETEEYIFHALGCEEEEIATDYGGKLITYLRQNQAFQESNRLGEWLLRKKKNDLFTDEDSIMLNEFAMTIYELGNYEEAIHYFEKSLSIMDKFIGENDPEKAVTLSNLGLTLNILGQHKKAINYCQKSIQIIRKKYKKYKQEEEYVIVANALNNMGMAYARLGKSLAAIHYLKKAHKIFRILYGENHSKVATALNNIGMAWSELSDFNKAAYCFEESIKIDLIVTGLEHPSMAKNFLNLGENFRDLGQPQKAIDYFQQALAIEKNVYGDTHDNVANLINLIGSSWLDLGKYDKALSYFNQSLSLTKKVYSQYHLRNAKILNNLGITHLILGHQKDSENYFAEALKICKLIFENNHPEVAMILNNIGDAMLDCGQYKEAINYFKKGLSINQDCYGNSHTMVATNLNNLGSAFAELGKNKKAKKYYIQSLEILKKVYKHNHPKISSTLNNLGLAYADLGKADQALDFYYESLAIDRDLFGEKHHKLSSTLNNIGSAWADLKIYQIAIDYYNKALSIDRDVFGKESKGIAIDLHNLGGAYYHIGEKDQAKDCFQESFDIYFKIYGPNHEYTKEARNCLDVVID